MPVGAISLDPTSYSSLLPPFALLEADADIEALIARIVHDHEAAMVVASLHKSGMPPALLGWKGSDKLAANFAASFNRELKFGRRRRGERERIAVTLDGDSGREVTLAATSFPLDRDTHVVLALDILVEESPLHWAEIYLALWWRRRCDVEASRGFRMALDRLDVGVILLDGDGAIHFANRQAIKLLEAGDGIRRLGRSVTALRFEDAVRLQTAIAMSQQKGSDQMLAPPLMLSRRKGRPLMAAIVPAARTYEHLCGPTVLIYLLDPDHDIEQLLNPVCSSYGLTPAETQLAKLIVGGRTLSEAAASLRIRPDTARSYLKQIFAKTSTHRQAELVRVVLSSVLGAGYTPA